jgi:effector-binding domain-containing protein
MVVDFTVKVAPNYRVAYVMHTGPYAGPNMWRSEFKELDRWAKKNKLRTGMWIMGFMESLGAYTTSRSRSIAALEIKGKAKSEGRIRIKTLPRQRVVSVVFNPEVIADRVIYHGIEGWLPYRPFREGGPAREVYDGNPWTDKKAWSKVEIQVPIRNR